MEVSLGGWERAQSAGRRPKFIVHGGLAVYTERAPNNSGRERCRADVSWMVAAIIREAYTNL